MTIEEARAAYDAALLAEVEAASKAWGKSRGHSNISYPEAGVLSRATRAAFDVWFEMQEASRPRLVLLPRATPNIDNYQCLDYTEQHEMKRDQQEEKQERMDYRRPWEGLS